MVRRRPGQAVHLPVVSRHGLGRVDVRVSFAENAIRHGDVTFMHGLPLRLPEVRRHLEAIDELFGLVRHLKDLHGHPRLHLSCTGGEFFGGRDIPARHSVPDLSSQLIMDERGASSCLGHATLLKKEHKINNYVESLPLRLPP